MFFFGRGELAHRLLARGKISLEEMEKLIRETKDSVSIPLENIRNVEHIGTKLLSWQKIVVTYLS
ncbi:MAG: hypothetical protein QXK48_02345 [Candidatus Aenigmatarchaeota archaeon]